MPAFPPFDLAVWTTADTPSDIPARPRISETSLFPPSPSRLLSIWEITSWILPMAPEHFRRVLAAEPHLPQGSAGAEGGTRWFSLADLAALRAHFATAGRSARYQPPRHPDARAPLVTLTGPMGSMGRSTALLHLAVAGALYGYRILVIEGDPAGTLGVTLPGDGSRDGHSAGQGALSLIAGSAARHLLRLNQDRLDRGDAPQPMEDRLAAALNLTAPDLIRPSLWPGLDVMPLSPQALTGDGLIAGWRQALRGWQPARALTTALDGDGLRQRYDLILCDTPRGLGALAMALLGSADTLLAPLPLLAGALPRLATGLQALSTATALTEAEAQGLARALGRAPVASPAQNLLVLPTRSGAEAARQIAGFATKLGDALLPDPLPEIPTVAMGQAAHLYDLDYRSLGRLTYAPLRHACDAACRKVITALTGFAAIPDITKDPL